VVGEELERRGMMDEYDEEKQNTDPGTAFPIVHPDGRGVQYFGLTMRDYFAAKAMQTLLNRDHIEYASRNMGSEPMKDLPRAAYAWADAMLAARAK